MLPVITAEDMAMLRAGVRGEYLPVEGDAVRMCAVIGQFVRAQLEREFEALSFAESLG